MKITIDRFEGEYAVCLTDDNIKIDIPAVLLPEGASEGNMYNMRFERLADEEKTVHERIEKKARRLWAD